MHDPRDFFRSVQVDTFSQISFESCSKWLSQHEHITKQRGKTADQ
jgi:hypothetical protein